MGQHTDVTFELPQLLRPSAISSETLWCHEFHQGLLQDMQPKLAGPDMRLLHTIEGSLLGRPCDCNCSARPRESVHPCTIP